MQVNWPLGLHCQKEPPDHAQLANKEFIGRGTALSPVREGAPAPEMAMLDD